MDQTHYQDVAPPEPVLDQFIPPPQWGDLPPNHRGFYSRKPYEHVGIYEWLWRHRSAYWKFVLAATVMCAFSSQGSAIGVAAAGVALYGGAKAEASRRLNVTRAWEQQANADYNRQLAGEWMEWLETRPLERFRTSTSPTMAAGRYVAENGSLYLGVDTTVRQELVLAGRRQSVLAVGAPGSGKTLGLAVPAVATHSGPAVFASTKLDGLRHTNRARAVLGTRWLYDPLRSITDEELRTIELEEGAPPIRRAYWSPLASVRDWNTAKLTAKGVIAAARYGPKADSNGRHWDLTAEELLAPMLLAARFHAHGSMDLLRRWIKLEDTDAPLTVLRGLLATTTGEAQVGASLAIDNIASRMLDRNVKHESDVWSTLKTMVQAYEFTGPMMDAGRQNFDPDAFVRSSDTLYIAGDAQVQEFAGPLFVSMIDALYQATTRFDKQFPFEGSNRPPLLCALDEARNIAPTPYLFRYLSEGLGQGFQTMVLLQSLSQAETVWGREGASISDFAAVKMLFGGLSDPGTLAAFSVLTGDYDREYVTYTTNESFARNEGSSQQVTSGFGQPGSQSVGTNMTEGFTAGTSQGTNVHKERRLTDGDLATLPHGEALVVMGSTWQIARVGGPLVGTWLEIFQGAAPPQGCAPPVGLARHVVAPPRPLPRQASKPEPELVRTLRLPPVPPVTTPTATQTPSPAAEHPPLLLPQTVIDGEDDVGDAIYRELRNRLMRGE